MDLQEKIKRRLSEREKIVRDIEKIVDLFAPAIKSLTEHDLKTYSMLSKPDALYSDCPLSSLHTYRWLKEHMIKRDMDFIGFALDGKPSLKTFSDRCSQANGWVMRFAEEPEQVKTGIDAIL